MSYLQHYSFRSKSLEHSGNDFYLLFKTNRENLLFSRMWKAFMVWYKNIRVKKVNSSCKALNDHLFLLQDVNKKNRNDGLIYSFLISIYRPYDLLYLIFEKCASVLVI